jgi:hypothetical protein
MDITFAISATPPTLKVNTIICKAIADCEGIDISVAVETAPSTAQLNPAVAGELAVGQLVEVHHYIQTLPEGHPLAPRGERVAQSETAALKTALPSLVGRIVALPEVIASGHSTSYIIRPAGLNPNDQNGVATVPDRVIPPAQSVESYGGFWYLGTHDIYPVE